MQRIVYLFNLKIALINDYLQLEIRFTQKYAKNKIWNWLPNYQWMRLINYKLEIYRVQFPVFQNQYCKTFKTKIEHFGLPCRTSKEEGFCVTY